jgi:hypothetical protein
MNRRNILSGFVGASVLSWTGKAFAQAPNSLLSNSQVSKVVPQEAALPQVPEAPRPTWQAGVLPPFVSAAPGSKVKAPAPGKTGMRHRRYTGRVDYLNAKRQEIGREFFTVTIQPDGIRTLRGMAEMDDFRLLRDVVVTVDGEWRGQDSYNRLLTEENFIGAAWNYYEDDGAEMEGYSFAQGRVSQRHRTDQRPRGSGAHLLHGDSWALIRWRQQNAGQPIGPGFSTSIQSNGGGGVFQNRGRGSRSTNTWLGKEVKKTAAGTFNTEHTRTLFNVGDQMDIWGMGEDAIPCYQEHVWPDAPTKIFELVELEGDYR